MDIRSHFPIFTHYPDLIYLDSAATALKPQSVIDAVTAYYSKYSSNIHRGLYPIAEQATAQYEQARHTIATFINAPSSDEIIFTSSTTDAINKLAFALERSHFIQSTSQIVTTNLEHHSNILPWQELTDRIGASLKQLPLNPDFQIDINKLDHYITPQTSLLCLSHVSNVIGIIQPLSEIIAAAKQLNPNLIVIIDGAQAVPHLSVDVQQIGCDFYTFSGHKLFGPTGIGVLWGKSSLLDQLPPFHYGGGMILDVDFTSSNHYQTSPAKFEAGTPPIAQAIGLAAAVHFLDEQDFQNTDLSAQVSSNTRLMGKKNISRFRHQHLSELTAYALSRLQLIEDLDIYGPRNPELRAGVISFNISGIHPHDLAQFLGSQNICIRAGHHCTLPFHRQLEISSSARVSLAIYNQQSDIDRLTSAIDSAIHIFHHD